MNVPFNITLRNPARVITKALFSAGVTPPAYGWQALPENSDIAVPGSSFEDSGSTPGTTAQDEIALPEDSQSPEDQGSTGYSPADVAQHGSQQHRHGGRDKQRGSPVQDHATSTEIVPGHGKPLSAVGFFSLRLKKALKNRVQKLFGSKTRVNEPAAGFVNNRSASPARYRTQSAASDDSSRGLLMAVRADNSSAPN